MNSGPSSSCLNSQTIACMPSSTNICRSDCGLAQQPLAQEPELLLEDVEGLGVLELLDLVLRRLEGARGLPVAVEVAPRLGPFPSQCSWMISESQLAATRAIFALSSGVTFTRAERAGDEMTDLLGLAVDDDLGLLEQLRDLLVAGLAVGALGDVLIGERHRRPAIRRQAGGARRGRPPARSPISRVTGPDGALGAKAAIGGAFDEAASSDMARAIESIEDSRASVASLSCSCSASSSM